MTEAEELEALLAAEVNTDPVVIDPNSNDEFHKALVLWANLRDRFDRVKKVKADLEIAVDNMAQALADAFETRKMTSITVKGIGKISTAANNNPNVLDQDRFFQWLRKVGEEGIIKRTAHYLTVKSLLNQRLDDGKSIPPTEVVELTQRRTLKLSREK